MTEEGSANVSRHPVAMSRAVLLFVALLTLLAACSPAPPPVPEGWQQHVLVPDGSDRVALSVDDDGAVTASAPSSNAGENLRVLFTRSSIAASQQQEVCTTFADSGGIAQEGIAFDIRTDAGRTRALTVTKNVWMHENSRFNVHEWDTARAGVLRQLDSIDMSHVLGRQIQGDSTWRLCGRLIGTKLEVTVVDPAAGANWSSPAVRSAIVPRSAEPGRPGWYIGHVRAGGWARFSNMSAGAPPATAPPTPVPTTTEPVSSP